MAGPKLFFNFIQNKWQKRAQLHGRNGRLSTKVAWCDVVSDAAANALICVTLTCVGYVSARRQMKDVSPALEKHRGSSTALTINKLWIKFLTC